MRGDDLQGEVHELAAPRAKPTTRAIAWAVTQLRCHDIAVLGPGRDARVAGTPSGTPSLQSSRPSWPRRIGWPGVDAWAWTSTSGATWAHPGTGLVTGIVDHSPRRGWPAPVLLLDLVPGRTGAAYGDWLIEQRPGR
ncbi:hypothetical protein QJS66_19645 [Kocuria rhizophila]|nr:hypothetical protein QJS66_19645 [Kocuria rhizophila]